MACISNIGNKYIAAEEVAYGTTPAPFTSINLGQIQKITVTEEDNAEKMSSLNAGHLAAAFEDGLYFCNVSIETRVTKASLPVLLDFVLGSRVDATDYTIASTPVSNSISLKFFYQGTKCGLLNGLVCKDFEISASKGETLTMTINCIAKKLSKITETLSVTTNTDAIFNWLDCKATIGGVACVLNSFSITGNWNVTDDEGRGIEAVTAGDRRLIQCVLQHRLDISGSYESEVNDTQEFGYTEERSDAALVFTVSRGTDNEHVFTMTKSRSFSRSQDLSVDNSKKVISYDYEAIDLGVTGDL